MDLERVPIGFFAKTITDYSNTVRRGLITWLDEFHVGGSRWKMGIAPGGADGKHDHLWLYMAVADLHRLPLGWYREAYVRLGLRSHLVRPMIVNYTQRTFTEKGSQYGTSLVELSLMHSPHDGYVIEDTVKVEATVLIMRAFPMAYDETCIGVNKLRQSLVSLGQYLKDAEPYPVKEERSHETPSPEEVEEAKQTLKDCLSCLYKLNFNHTVTASLTTLMSAKEGLSAEQKDCMLKLQGNLDSCVWDYLVFEARNSDFELGKLEREQIVSSLKGLQEKQIEYKKKMDELMREGEQLEEHMKVGCGSREQELRLRLERVEDGKMKLVLLMEITVANAKETLSSYEDKEKEVAEASEMKRFAEERMATSSMIWSCLKSYFG